MSLQAKLADLDEKDGPETPILSYLRWLIKQVKEPALIQYNELEQAEDMMFDSLSQKEKKDETFRLILQTWFLYPGLLKHPEKLEELY